MPRMAGCIASVIFIAAACSDWPNGLPVQIAFGNWTSTPITIVREERGGAETVLVDRLDPQQVTFIGTNESNVACHAGAYIARDAAGAEVERLSTDWCTNWVVASGPIPISISNRTAAPLELIYAGKEEIVLSTSLAPGKEFMATVNEFGDPSQLCFGGDLRARVEGGVEQSRPFLRSCADWVWVITSPSAPPAN